MSTFAPARAPFTWLLQREVVRYLRIWPNAILGQLSMPLLMLVVFGYAIDRGTGGHHVDGLPYAQYILPGLIGQTVMTVGWTNGTISLFDARRERYLNDVLSSPLRWWEINLACVLAAMIRQAFTAGLVAAITIPIAGAHVQRPLILALGTLGAMLFAAQAGVIAGTYVRTMDQNVSLQTLVIQPLTFLGGTFYPIASLPPVWRAISHLNPIFYVIQVMRIGFDGRADLSAGAGLAVLWGMALLLTTWSLAMFRSGRRLKG